MDTIQIHPRAKLLASFDLRRPESDTTFKVNYWRGPAVVSALRTWTVFDGFTNGMAVSTPAAVYDKKLYVEGEPSYDDHRRYLADMKKTKLAVPLEMVHFGFAISGVTRAFTHQLVRYRVGCSFAQLSMRVAGIADEYQILVGPQIQSDNDLTIYVNGCNAAIAAYDRLAVGKKFSEDARGALPHNILTGIWADISLRTLMNICAQRLCCQAQPGEWQPLLFQMRTQIKKIMGEDIEVFLRSPWEINKDCGFHGSSDMPCHWRGHQISEIAEKEWNLETDTTIDVKGI